MSSNSKLFVAPFVGGLNTELNDTTDALTNTSDELNCTLLRGGKRGRRYGFNIERDGQWFDTGEDIEAHSVYFWSNADEDINFIIVQVNKKLYIFNEDSPITLNDPKATINLSKYLYGNVTPLSMKTVTNNLFISGKNTYPLVIKYDSDTDTFSEPVVNNLKFRDFNGIDDGLEVDEMPTTLSQEHLYNLFNQGWDMSIYNPDTKITSRLVIPEGGGLFFDTYSKYPANNLQWFMGKEKSGEYNTTDLLNTYFGNTEAPKGHYILDYLTRSRTISSGIELAQDANYDATPYVKNIAFSAMTDWYTARAGSAMMGFYNDIYTDLNQQFPYYTDSFTTFYDLPAEVTGTISSVNVTITDSLKGLAEFMGRRIGFNYNSGLNLSRGTFFNQAYKYCYNEYNDNTVLSAAGYLLCIPFKIILSGIKEDGTVEELGYTTANLSTDKSFNTSDSFTLTTGNVSSYSRYRVTLQWNFGKKYRCWAPNSINIKTLVNTTTGYVGIPSSDVLKGEVTDVETFGGRIFYLCNNTVLFSQTLGTDNTNYDKCYQDADPTSEDVSDVIATDGGMIQLLSLGYGKALKSFYRGVLVFGNNEVTGILSNNTDTFTATSYDTVKITSAGLAGKYSVVEADNVLYYWSSHGIFVITLDTSSNTITAESISISTIQNWYNNLSELSKENCVGYFDFANNRIFWFYPSTEDVDNLDSCLVYDINNKCFMPQAISIDSSKKLTDCAESSKVTDIEPTTYLRADGDRVVAGDYKVLAANVEDVSYNRKSSGILLISDGTKFGFGDFNSREFRDWDEHSYDSYMVSRPITLGDTYFNKQTPIMQTLFQRTEMNKMNAGKKLARVAVELPVGFPTDTGKYYRCCTPELPFSMYITGVRVLLDDDFKINSDSVVKKIPYVSVKDYDRSSTLLKSDSTVEDGVKDFYFSYYRGVKTGQAQIEVSFNNGMFSYDPEHVKVIVEGLIDEDIGEEHISKLSYDNVNTLTRTLSISKFEKRDDGKCYFTFEVPSESYLCGGKINFTLHGIDTSEYFQFFLYDADGSFYDPHGNHTNSLNSGKYAFNTENFDKDLTNCIDPHRPLRIVAKIGSGFDNLSSVDVSYTMNFMSYETSLPEPLETSQEYITPSGANIRMRWGWSLSDRSNRWDMIQNGYRPQKDFLYDDYVESRMHIRGRGKAFQVEIRNDEDKDFRLLGLNIVTRGQ